MNTFAMTGAVALLILPGLARAQIKEGTQLIGAEAGLTLPMSDLSGSAVSSDKYGAAGPSIGVSYEYMLVDNLGIGGSFNYRSFGTNNVTVGSAGVSRGFSADDWNLLLQARYQPMPGDQLRPYGLLGVGLGRASRSASGGVGYSGDGTGVAYAVGVGADYDLNSQWCLGAEARWTGLSVDLSPAPPGTGASQTFDSLDFLVTARFKLGS